MIKIYGKPSCTYCIRARSLCESKGLEYEYITVGKDIDADELKELCPVPVRSVPQIFDNEDYIGGFNEFTKYQEGL